MVMAIMLRKGSSMVTDWGLFFSIPNTNKGLENVSFYHDGEAILFHRFNGTNNPNIGKNLAFIVCEKNGEYKICNLILSVSLFLLFLLLMIWIIKNLHHPFYPLAIQ